MAGIFSETYGKLGYRLIGPIDPNKFDNASSLVGLARSLNLFDVFDGPKNTAYSIAQSRRSFHDWIRIHDLWPSFGTSPFAEAAFNAYLQSTDDFRRSIEFVDVLLFFFNKMLKRAENLIG